jgi:hypothetical protein
LITRLSALTLRRISCNIFIPDLKYPQMGVFCLFFSLYFCSVKI